MSYISKLLTGIIAPVSRKLRSITAMKPAVPQIVQANDQLASSYQTARTMVRIVRTAEPPRDISPNCQF